MENFEFCFTKHTNTLSEYHKESCVLIIYFFFNNCKDGGSQQS